MFRLFFLFTFMISGNFSAQFFYGIVLDEDQNPLPAVLIFNLRSEEKAYTNIQGEFSIGAKPTDELRFIRSSFERGSIIMGNTEFTSPITVVLTRIATEIEEVAISNINLTGDLNFDSQNLSKFDKVAKLRSEIGVPGPPEKPREKPAEAVRDIFIPLLSITPTVNIQAIYDVLSGKARRQKSFYNFQDLQDNLHWIRERVEDDYFTKMGIPSVKISQFIQFSIGLKPEINSAVKTKNLSKVLLLFEETSPKFLKNLNVKHILK